LNAHALEPIATQTLIKVRFPNRVELQATFHPLEKAEAVYKVVKESLAHPDRPFYLCTPTYPFPLRSIT